MKIIKLLAVISFLLILSTCSSKFVHKDYPLYSVMQGPTNDTETSISIVFPEKLQPKITFTDQTGALIPFKSYIKREYMKFNAPFKVVNYFFKNLDPKKTYKISISGLKGKNDERTFRTLPDSRNKKVMIASCMSDTFNDIGDIVWPNVYKNKPDMMFLIGDNIYADVYSGIYIGVASTPEHLWDRHLDARVKLKLYHEKHLVPVFALWDDHDFGKNDGNSSYIYKKEALEFFNIFFARHPMKNYKFGPAMSSHLKVGKNNYYFLDGRYFRGKPGSKEHLGKKQYTWLFNKIKNSKEPNFLIKGDQFFGGYHIRESFEGNHPKAFKRFINDLKAANTKVAFISGDRHFYELQEIEKDVLGYKTYEFTSSGIHAKTFPGTQKHETNKRRIGGKDGVYNYMILESTDGYPQKIKMTVYDETNEILDSKHLEI